MTGTSIDLSVEAMVTTTELPYESVLVSKYKDGQERRHNISGTYQETLLTNIQVVEVIPSFCEKTVSLTNAFTHCILCFGKHLRRDYPFESSCKLLYNVQEQGGVLGRKKAASHVKGLRVAKDDALGNCAK